MKLHLQAQLRPYRVSMVRYMTWFILLLSGIFSGINLAVGNLLLGSFQILIAGFCLFLMIILDRTERLQAWIVVLLTLIFFAICLSIATDSLTAGGALWLWTIPIISILMLGLRLGAIVSLLFLGIGLGVFFLRYFSLGYSLNPLLITNVVTSLVCLWIFSYAYTRYQEAMVSVLHERATRDPLTGLNNRRHLRVVYRQVLSEHQRSQHPFSLVMLDIDWFKKLNDHYGHDFGDRVLVSLADLMTRHTRGQDSLFRVGGEEFCILLPDTDREEARVVAERLRADFAARIFKHRGRVVRSSVSVGIATAPMDGIDHDALYRKADQRLYAAKNGGRNQVVSA